MTTDEVRAAARRRSSRFLDRLFVGGCTALYLALVATVIAAVRIYGG